MKSYLKSVLILAAGVILGLSAQVIAKPSKPTDVRVGPTAAIGIATSSDGAIVYIANGNGVFKSVNAGSSWVKVY
jgi:hypothetical protein